MRYKILKNNKEINTIVADETFVTTYCKKHGYTFEEAPLPEAAPSPETAPEPTQFDIIEAQVAYTAMMTDTLLEV